MGPVLVLSLLSGLNPTLLAATTVLLLLPNPKRLMLGYLLGALMTSITLGLVIESSLWGLAPSRRPRTRSAPRCRSGNSMASVTIPHWLFGQQDGTIRDQLDQGSHGLLIDTYYGFAVPGGVRTDLQTCPNANSPSRRSAPRLSTLHWRSGRDWDPVRRATAEYFYAMASARSDRYRWPLPFLTCARSWCPTRVR